MLTVISSSLPHSCAPDSADTIELFQLTEPFHPTLQENAIGRTFRPSVFSEWCLWQQKYFRAIEIWRELNDGRGAAQFPEGANSFIGDWNRIDFWIRTIGHALW
ncbi:hypothetical protein CDAR_597251 [Caerostris darwini]|uniref:Uncharacterized protein n=1 Tax=Caerostris darwini TaxID=1538125 RepID=A0AAV4U2R6_9ARAC|nr:hypothetical protein CDAR_597251 [Caerostris darwini]